MREKAFAEIESGLSALNSVTSIREILSIEGYAARTYFQVWRGLHLQWTGERQNPVPPMLQVFDQRSSLLTGKNSENWKASHPINAMLNYAYAVLEAATRMGTVAALALSGRTAEAESALKALLAIAPQLAFSAGTHWWRNGGWPRMREGLRRAGFPEVAPL